MTPIEITVKVSNEEQKYSQKFLCYDNLTISHDDPKLKGYVNEAIENFKDAGSIDDVVVKFSYSWEHV